MKASFLGNLALALVLIVGAKIFMTTQGPSEQAPAPRQRRRVWPEPSRQAAIQFDDLLGAPRSPQPTSDWREAVGSNVVAYAWHLLCGSIVQEVCCVSVAAASGRRGCQACACPCASLAAQAQHPHPRHPPAQFIYDIWYSSVTPDCEFPAKIRALLNDAFGKLAVRSRRADLQAVLNDLSELLMEQVPHRVGTLHCQP